MGEVVGRVCGQIVDAILQVQTFWNELAQDCQDVQKWVGARGVLEAISNMEQKKKKIFERHYGQRIALSEQQWAVIAFQSHQAFLGMDRAKANLTKFMANMPTTQEEREAVYAKMKPLRLSIEQGTLALG